LVAPPPVAMRERGSPMNAAAARAASPNTYEEQFTMPAKTAKPATMMTPNELADALASARAGDRITYFTGHLATTCEQDSAEASAARSIRAYAMSQYETGRALLAQRRDGRDFRYMAIRTAA